VPLYRVVWEIDIDADLPVEAAKMAFRILKDPASMRPIFVVRDSPSANALGDEQVYEEIDLEDYEDV